MNRECSEILLKNSRREASKKSQKTLPTRYEQRATIYLIMQNKNHHARENRNEAGFAILAIMGLLVALTIAITILLPNGITSHDIQDTDTERQNLHAIGQGTKTYLQANRSWPPTLAAHNPGYAPFASIQLSQNDRLFPRYYFAHPNTSAFTNGTGLTESNLIDVRFLLISNLSADAAPTITNATEFETWWTTDESATPNLHIYRGNLASQFHEVRLKGIGNGGSYQIDGTSTNSGGSTLTEYRRYHAAGTPVSLDEADTYGTPEVQFAATGNVAYQFDPTCHPGSRWKVAPEAQCGCPLRGSLSIANAGFETGDLTGWTKTGDLDGNGGTNQWGSVTSSYYMASAPSGTYFANGDATGATGSNAHTTGISQRIDVSECATEIDAGDLTVTFAATGHGESGPSCWTDPGWVRIEFYDAVSGGSQVGSTIDSNQALTQSYWENVSSSITTIPATARSIEVLALGSKPACGSLLNAGIDDLFGFIGDSSFTFLDQFNAITYNGNDGTQTWSNDWQEIGESNGPTQDLVMVDTDTKCASGNCLRLRGKGDGELNGKGISREADLTGTTTATLTFSYRRRVDVAGGAITLAVSGNGGTNWTNLQTYVMDAEDASQVPQTFDMTPYISSDTQIRFLGTASTVEGRLFIDNIQIEAY